METAHRDLLRTLEAYAQIYQEPEIRNLLASAEKNSNLTKRSNLEGHITASGLVLHEGKLLLVFHKKLQRYLQPGGHVDDGESLLEAAQREVFEETGIQTLPMFDGVEAGAPIHIDVHTIPYNEKKNEPEHTHYDCMFLLTQAIACVTIRAPSGALSFIFHFIQPLVFPA